MRPHPAVIELAAGRSLPKVLDPVPMLRSALEHGMGGVLLTQVEQTDQPWRTLVLRMLEVRQRKVEAWHERLWHGLDSVLGVLHDVGVEVALAKGLAAEARWYARRGERPSTDLDLLLSPADLARIDDIIAAVEPSHPLCGRTLRLAQQGYLQSIDLIHDGVPIDLHWDILKIGIPSRNLDNIWERTVKFDLPHRTTLRVLDAETSYVHFLVHLNKDRFRRLMGFSDVARVYQREALDGQAVDLLVRRDGLATSVHGSWNVVVDTLGLIAPRRPVVSRARNLIWQLAWPESVRLRAGPTLRFRYRQYLIALLIPGRLTEAIMRWLRGRFPPADLLAYVHSDYARRWGDEPVTDASATRLWSLTIGRLRAWSGRREAARLKSKNNDQSSMDRAVRDGLAPD